MPLPESPAPEWERRGGSGARQKGILCSPLGNNHLLPLECGAWWREARLREPGELIVADIGAALSGSGRWAAYGHPQDGSEGFALSLHRPCCVALWAKASHTGTEPRSEPQILLVKSRPRLEDVWRGRPHPREPTPGERGPWELGEPEPVPFGRLQGKHD
ncbi:multiple epidermal growth factor-like domains protein 11 [Platysternon megacephalum]|uniref:Multiple epidermal growth factor-like domains protein 11 n=1 Tax=Platysternon megacephalum TaxID=55544 RepID=A0A4D9F6J0_9SAUR|nr:multiple epidermal growth factor-like domains protein 11 [Platysternon megacephalum]